MLIRLDLDDETPIYTQLMQQIIEGIASGALKPGEALPSVRSLAADIGINLHTVNKAYTLLKQEGFIRIHRQKGVVVEPDCLPSVTEAYKAALNKKLRPLVAEAICRGLSADQFTEAAAELYRSIIDQEEADSL